MGYKRSFPPKKTLDYSNILWIETFKIIYASIFIMQLHVWLGHAWKFYNELICHTNDSYAQVLWSVVQLCVSTVYTVMRCNILILTNEKDENVECIFPRTFLPCTCIINIIIKDYLILFLNFVPLSSLTHKYTNLCSPLWNETVAVSCKPPGSIQNEQVSSPPTQEKNSVLF